MKRKRYAEVPLFLSAYMHREETRKRGLFGSQEEKPHQEADTVLDRTLFLEFHPPELCENKFLMHKSLSLRYSVVSAQAD